MDNLLIQGENLVGLNYLLNDRGLKGQFDLVYIDPPFATGSKFRMSEGRAATISSSDEGKIAYSDHLTGRDFLDFLRSRLILIRELLSERGSIYLHIDCKIGHYVKILMDDFFGIQQFRNEITRIKCNPKNFRRLGFGNVKDTILFYTKTGQAIWNEPSLPFLPSDQKKRYPKINSTGRRYTTVPIHAPGETKNGASGLPFRGISPPPGRHWRTGIDTLEEWDRQGLIEWSSTGNPRKIIYADEHLGRRVQDIWDFKDPAYPKYPTEKNAEMLDLIIQTSSLPGSLVLDCFCGSGTALKSAQKQERFWIGIDQSESAIEKTREKLASLKADLFHPSVQYDFLLL